MQRYVQAQWPLGRVTLAAIPPLELETRARKQLTLRPGLAQIVLQEPMVRLEHNTKSLRNSHKQFQGFGKESRATQLLRNARNQRKVVLNDSNIRSSTQAKDAHVERPSITASLRAAEEEEEKKEDGHTSEARAWAAQGKRERAARVAGEEPWSARRSWTERVGSEVARWARTEETVGRRREERLQETKTMQR